MKTKCLIVDDEPLAIKVIESHIGKMPDLEVTATCRNAVEAFDVLMKKPVDLMFLDVEMPEITGLEFLKSLRNRPAVIITTAYREFALDAYESDAIDYLLKPVSFERFFKAVSRYYRWKGRDLPESGRVPGREPFDEAFIYVRADRKVVKIRLNDILFIESLKDYVKIHLKDEMIITKEKISRLEEKLPGEKFIRTHRSFIVAADRIRAFTAETIEIGAHEIPVGRTYKNSVFGFLGYRD